MKKGGGVAGKTAFPPPENQTEVFFKLSLPAFSGSLNERTRASVFDRVAGLVERLFAIFGPLSPHDLAGTLGIEVRELFYRGINGFSWRSKEGGERVVLVSAALSRRKKDGVLLHEVAHQLLHEGVSRFYLENDPLGRVDKYEVESHLFALLYALRWDREGFEECGYDIYRFAEQYGVSKRVVIGFWDRWAEVLVKR